MGRGLTRLASKQVVLTLWLFVNGQAQVARPNADDTLQEVVMINTFSNGDATQIVAENATWLHRSRIGMVDAEYEATGFSGEAGNKSYAEFGILTSSVGPLKPTITNPEADDFSVWFGLGHTAATADFVPEPGSGMLSEATIGGRLEIVSYAVVPSLFVVGLFGNVMTLVIMQSAVFRISSTVVILTTLALSDITITLMTPFNKVFFERLTGFDVRGVHWISCKAFFWVWRSAKMTSSWFVVLVSLERFIAVRHSLKARDLITKRRAIYAVAVVYCFVAVYNAIRSAFSDVLKNQKCQNSAPEAHVNKVFVRGLAVGGTALCTHVPGALVLLLNLASVSFLVRQTQARRSLTAEHANRQTKRTEKVSRQLSAMLLGISFAFLVLMTPIAILHAVTIFRRVSIYWAKDVTYVILRELAMTLEQLNYSINFYLYVLCSRIFRKQFVVLMTCARQSRDRELLTTFSEDENTVRMSKEGIFMTNMSDISSSNDKEQNGGETIRI